MKKIRMLESMIIAGGTALSAGDDVSVGGGKDSVDKETAERLVRGGFALDLDRRATGGDPPARAASRVVIHERGGQELLQSASTVGEGPAPENPTDSDPKEGAAEGDSRTAAGAVIEENAGKHPQAPDPESTDTPAKSRKR